MHKTQMSQSTKLYENKKFNFCKKLGRNIEH